MLFIYFFLRPSLRFRLKKSAKTDPRPTDKFYGHENSISVQISGILRIAASSIKDLPGSQSQTEVFIKASNTVAKQVRNDIFVGYNDETPLILALSIELKLNRTSRKVYLRLDVMLNQFSLEITNNFIQLYTI